MNEYQDHARTSAKKEKQRYFQEALSDFTYDVASAGAVRHLVDLGHSTDQIMRELPYPAARARVEKMVYRHMTDAGILLEELPMPQERMEAVYRKPGNFSEVCICLRKLIDCNGEENSFVECPYGTWHRDRERRLQAALSCLTAREREYILGIPWPMRTVYHRLNSRMAEIGMQLAAQPGAEIRFYFFGSRQVVEFSDRKNRGEEQDE